MKTRFLLIVSVLIIGLSLLAVTVALADPLDPFGGTAEAVAIDANLSISVVGATTVDVGAIVISETAKISGAGGVVSTNGAGKGIGISESSPLINADIDIVQTQAMRDTNSPGSTTDDDFVATLNTLLVDTDLITSTTRSDSLTTRQTIGEGSVDNLSVFSDPIGIESLLQANTITSLVNTASTASGTDVNETAAADLEGVSAALFPSTGLEQIVTADVISSNTATTCDSETDNTAFADYNFVNLQIQGVSVNVDTPGAQVIVEINNVDVAVVTIAPVLSQNVTSTTASAEAVALRIEILEDIGSLTSGTIINLATSRSSCYTPEPTAVGLSTIQAAALPGSFVMIAISGVILIIYSVYVLRRRQTIR